MVPLLLVLREKQFGLSSSYRYVGSFILPKNSYFNYQREPDAWQVHFGLGIIGVSFLIFGLDLYEAPEITPSSIYSLNNWEVFALGGLLVGFGARYAGGCTAGHCITGNSLFSIASLIATCMFFVGGLIISHFVIPFFVEA